MDKTALVSFDIENGKEVIDALDRAGKTPKVALWAKLPEYEDWRLIIASDRLNQSGSLLDIPKSMARSKKLEFPLASGRQFLCVL